MSLSKIVLGLLLDTLINPTMIINRPIIISINHEVLSITGILAFYTS